jgi:hypothetical protein
MPVRHASIFSIALLAALVSPAAAETLYKSTMPDGRVIYGDKPAPGAVKSEKQVLDTSPKGVVAPKAPATAKKPAGTEDSKEERIRAAEKALKDAEAAQAAGKDPTAGDRQGTVSGAQRLTDEYWARQKRLQEAVDLARANLEKAKAAK